MHPGTDPMSGSSSFTARRSAASSLPNFELPPPPLSAPNTRFLPFGSLNSNPTGSGSVANLGNLPTPPSAFPGDSLSSPSSSNLGGGSYHAKSASYPNNQYWSQPSQGGYGYQQGGSQWNSDRSYLGNNSMHSMMRGGDVAQSGRDASSSANDMFQLPPFPTSMPSSGAISLPAMAAVSQQPMHSGLLHQQMVGGVGSGQHDAHSGNQDSFQSRLPPTPSYFNQSQPSPPSQQQQGFSFSSATSPSSRSPMSSNGHSSRMSPLGQNTGEMQNMHASSNPHSPPPYQRQFSQYGLPAVSGPVMTNLHSPNANLALVGGMRNNMMTSFNSGQAANMQQMYGSIHGGGHGPMNGQQNEKPFKCDQCMQSFNRNHDLKRHKRIHLAVKPYPCGHCDKSFSRKDALKRHMLVKGCGKAHEATNGHHERGSGSPDSPEVGYDSGSSSPSMPDERRVNGASARR